MKLSGLFNEKNIKCTNYSLDKLLEYVDRRMKHVVKNIDVVVKVQYILPELWKDLLIQGKPEERIKKLTLKEFFETLDDGKFCRKPEKIGLSVRFFDELKDKKDNLIMANDEYEDGFLDVNLKRENADFDNDSIFIKPKYLNLEEVYQIGENNDEYRYYPEDLDYDLLNQLYKRINMIRNYNKRNFRSRGYLERWIVFSSDKPEYLKVKKDPEVKMERALLLKETKKVKTNCEFSFYKFSLRRNPAFNVDNLLEDFGETMDNILGYVEDVIELKEKEINSEKPEEVIIKLIYKDSTHIERGIKVVMNNVKIGEVIDVFKNQNNSLIYASIKYIYFSYITKRTKTYLVRKNSSSYIELITLDSDELISTKGENIIPCHSKRKWIFDKLSLNIKNYINDRISRFSNWVAVQLLGVS